MPHLGQMVLGDAVGVVAVEGGGDDSGVGGGEGGLLPAALAGPGAASLKAPPQEAPSGSAVVVIGCSTTHALLRPAASQKHSGERTGAEGLAL